MSASDYGAFAYPVDGNLTPLTCDPFEQAAADLGEIHAPSAYSFTYPPTFQGGQPS